MNKKILVVDDSQLVRNVLSDSLTANDFQVDLACGGQECLDKLKESDYYLAIIDYLMPDINGLEVLETISKDNNEIPVIILTGEGSEATAVQAMKLGALDYVIKNEKYCERIIDIINSSKNICEGMSHQRNIERNQSEDELSSEKTKLKDRILVVDDSKLIRDMVFQELRNNNFEADLASGGYQCLEKIKKNNYALAIIDYRMPDLNGLEVLKCISDENLKIPVIILTGEGSEKTAVQAMKLGALDYITKTPGYISTLSDVVRDNLYIYRANLKGNERKQSEGAVRVRERILVVDDSRTAREKVKELLCKEHYDVDTAADGAEAIKKINFNDYDLAIVDYLMPEINGLDVLREITIKEMDIPVIILTGKGSEETAVQAMKLGALDYIVKTIGYFDLMAEIVQRSIHINKIKKEKRSLEKQLLQKNMDLEERIRQLKALNEISKQIEESLDLKDTLTVIVSKISELLRCTRVTIMLLDPERKYLNIWAAKGFPEEEIKKVKVRFGEGISGYVVETGQPLFISNIEEDSRFGKTNQEQYFTKSLISVPLKIRENVIGVINVNNKRRCLPFTHEDKDILSTISCNAAIAIEKSKYYEEMRIAGITDGLTGLYNQRFFYKNIELEIEKVRRYNTCLTLMIIDLDDFKIVNDTYGHLQGDLVLVEIGRILSEKIRRIDIIARYGGEEFVIILPQTKVSDAKILAERIRKSIEEHQFSSLALKDLKITASIGLAEFHKDLDQKEFVEIVDQALYLAKQKGKNTFFIFDTSRLKKKNSS